MKDKLFGALFIVGIIIFLFFALKGIAGMPAGLWPFIRI